MVLCLCVFDDQDHDLWILDRIGAIGYFVELLSLDHGGWWMVGGQYIFVCVSLSVVS